MYFDTYVLAMGRTGANAIGEIFNSHPDINLPTVALNDLAINYHRLFAGPTKRVNLYYQHTAKNAWHYPVIEPYLTRQRMLHLVRHPFDNLRSIYNMNLYAAQIGNRNQMPASTDFFSNINEYAICNTLATGVPLYERFSQVKCIEFNEMHSDLLPATAKAVYQWLGLDPIRAQPLERAHSYNDIMLLVTKEPLWLQLDTRHRLPLYVGYDRRQPGDGHEAARGWSQYFRQLASLDLSGTDYGRTLWLNQLQIWVNVPQLQALPEALQREFCQHAEPLIAAELPRWVARLAALDAGARQGQITELPDIAKQNILALCRPYLGEFYRRFPHIEAIWQLPS